MTHCLLPNPQEDLNHLHIIIKPNLNTVPHYVTTPVQLQVTVRKITIGGFSGKGGSSSALVFPGEMFVHSSFIVSILSVDTVDK